MTPMRKFCTFLGQSRIRLTPLKTGEYIALAAGRRARSQVERGVFPEGDLPGGLR